MQVDLLPNGVVGLIAHAGILLNQSRGVPPEGAPFRIWLRSNGDLISLLDPAGITEFGRLDARHAVWKGFRTSWHWQILLALDDDQPAWTWRVEIALTGADMRMAETILAQDIGLADLDYVRANENYCSHYIDHTPLQHPEWGPVICSRQNAAQKDGRHPWLATACPTGAAAYATDGLDVYGIEQRVSGRPRVANDMPLPSRRRQGETACAALQSHTVQIAPDAPAVFSFRLTYRPDHPAPTSAADIVPLTAGDTPVPTGSGQPVARSIWDEPRVIHGAAFDAAAWNRWFPDRRQEEWLNTQLASFFTPDARHVVARVKEETSERSHGHVLLGSERLLPDEEALGATVYASGVFAAQVYQDNPSVARILTVLRDPLHRTRAAGQRIWIWHEDTWQLLGTPSAFVMGLNHAEWWYQLPGSLLHIVSRVETMPSAVVLECRVAEGAPPRWLVTHQLCLDDNELDHGGQMEIRPYEGQILLTPHPDTQDARHNPGRSYCLSVLPVDTLASLGGDEAIWLDHRPRGAPFAVVSTNPALKVTVRIQTATFAVMAGKHPGSGGGPAPWSIISGPEKLATLNEILPWFRHDAWIHLASPHGLEQYGGGAWGVRDVCQGPVEWLLGEQRYAEVREILRIVFAQQYDDTGLWPQWFMLGRYAGIRQRHCHGDIMFWPIKALCDYAEAANDLAILNLVVPYTDQNGATIHPQPLSDHVNRIMENFRERCVGGTTLVAYGDGDWDDTLQPARPEMRQAMVSTWTVQLAYQTFGQWAALLKRAGHDQQADRVTELQTEIRHDFQRHLMPDGIVAGFALHRNGNFEPLLHPRDDLSGIQYRLLPMTRGVLSGIFTPAQARMHRLLIHDHLRFPDGVRLMNRPVAYAGGICRLFQRAETAAYFGREVALQYVHAHLRYAEAMARLGDSNETWWALQIVNPIGLPVRLPNAALRQANVYFSSSDGDFADRYEATARFDELRDGRRMVKSGWRLYSSGPGLYLHKVRSGLFGIREYYDRIVWDPMLADTLTPCQLHMSYEGKKVVVQYSAQTESWFRINGRVPSTAVAVADNPYRTGGISVDRKEFRQLLDRDLNLVQVATPESKTSL